MTEIVICKLKAVLNIRCQFFAHTATTVIEFLVAELVVTAMKIDLTKNQVNRYMQTQIRT